MLITHTMTPVDDPTHGPLEVWKFCCERRPWTINFERKKSHWQRATDTKQWRESVAWYARAACAPLMTDARVGVHVYLKGRLQDTAACLPAAKAAIDGLVDAGMFVDDTGDHIHAITFHAPLRNTADAMLLEVVGRVVTRRGYTAPQ